MSGAVFLQARWASSRWMKDSKGGPRPINARIKVVVTNGMLK